MTEPTDRPAPREQRGGPGGRGPGGPPRQGGNRGGPDRRPGPEPFRGIDPADLRAIIVDGNTAKTVQEAQRLAHSLAGDRPEGRLATSHALRTLFGDLRRAEMEWDAGGDGSKVALLKPKLAYLAGRASIAGRGVNDVQGALGPAIDLVDNDRDRFGRLVQFFDAILAYYYAGPQYGGR